MLLLELSLPLEPAFEAERDLLCWACDLPGVEWKLTIHHERGVSWKGIHGRCKVLLESRRSPSKCMEKVTP